MDGMNESEKKSFEITKKIHKDMLSSISFENKEFEGEVIALFRELFESEEAIILEFYKNHSSDFCGLDGGYTSDVRKLNREYFKRLDELKKKYGIK